MKRVTKIMTTVLVVLVMVLSVVLTACENESHDFTVKVVGPDGNPYTSALVQPCSVGANGKLDVCYEGVETDEQGVAYLDLGKEIPNTEIDEIEVHLLELPATLTYESIRMKKGETKTIQITEVSNPEVPGLKTPTSGTGKGSYESDMITGENKIDLETFDPYIVIEGSYKLKFEQADQKIYYAFKANESAVYKVYSEGDIDAAVVQLLGTVKAGLRNSGEEEYCNDNASSSDYNFYYEFDVEEAAVQNEIYSYFEVSLSNSEDVGKEAVISFKYVSEIQGGGEPTITDKYPANSLDEYTMVGNYVNAPIDGSCVYVKGQDGYYHLGNEEGPILVATLGTDASLNIKHSGNSVAPRGLEFGFTLIVAQGASLTIYKNNQGYNYYPMIMEYTKVSNSEGRYPLTDELIDFLNGYLVNIYTIEWFEESNNIKLPSQNPWLVWCGYYEA